MKIVCTSDLHGALPQDLPDGDVLVVAGDLCPVWDHDRKYQANWSKGELRPFLENLSYDEILLIAGNHDFVYYESNKPKSWFSGKLHYLQDDGIEINGVKFWGSPWSSKFGDWAFMAPEMILQHKWQMIPDDTNVLLVHGPPYGVVDRVQWGNESVGSESLRRRILDLDLDLVVTGHIHEAYGVDRIGETIVANVSHRNFDYDPVNPAMVFEV